jgi:hypothetical protein
VTGFLLPKEGIDCNGGFECIGPIVRLPVTEIWLNVKDSVLEVKTELQYTCLGRKEPTWTVTDACPGSWGWRDKRLIDYKKILQSCSYGIPKVMGVKCTEWSRAYNMIGEEKIIRIAIDDAKKTGVRISCDYKESSFPGGEEELQKFLNKNVHYPDSLLHSCIEGSLRLPFQIDSMGLVKDFYFDHPTLGVAFEEECRRIITMMPPWIPATCNGRKAFSEQSLTIQFKIPEHVKCDSVIVRDPWN